MTDNLHQGMMAKIGVLLDICFLSAAAVVTEHHLNQALNLVSAIEEIAGPREIGIFIATMLVLSGLYLVGRSKEKRRLSNSGNTVSSTKPCPVCGEEIPSSAKICKHCKSDLTWRSYLHISQTTLALVTALVAVAGTVGSNILELFVPAYDVTFSVLGSKGMETVVEVANDGAKTTSVRSLHVMINKDLPDGRYFSWRVKYLPANYMLVKSKEIVNAILTADSNSVRRSEMSKEQFISAVKKDGFCSATLLTSYGSRSLGPHSPVNCEDFAWVETKLAPPKIREQD